MKICHIVPWFPSKDPISFESRLGIFELRQLSKLAERGHEFKVISLRWNGQNNHEVFNSKIEVWRIPYFFSIVGYPLPHFIALTNKIKEVCDNWHPDLIVYSHADYLTALPCLYLKKKYNIPVVVTIDCIFGLNVFSRNKMIDTVAYMHAISLVKAILKQADGVQLLSSDLHEHISKLNISQDKVFTITRGVDTELFKPGDGDNHLRNELGIKNSDIVIIYVGRIDFIKGVDYLLEAAKEIILEYESAKFLIVGDGKLREKFQRATQRFSKNIIFTGFRENIPQLMNISDIFVLPSLAEGAANAVMEASASGLPVIATEVGEVPQIVLNEKTGILIRPKDVDGLVNALKKLIDDPLFTKEMGRLGRKRMEEEYRWDIICKKIENAYQEVIDRYR